MIDRKENKDKTEYNLDRIVQASFGYSDEQLLEQMKQAEETVSDTQIPPESEHGFEELIAKADSRGVTPYTEDKDSGEGEDRKIRRLGPIVKVGLAVAVMTSVLLMTSITAGAKRSYKYEAKTRIENKKEVVLNNNNENMGNASLEYVYNDIHNQLGVNVLALGEIPINFVYEKTALNGQKATMYFTYEKESIYLMQMLGSIEYSASFVTDRVNDSDDIIYNSWLKENIPISRANVSENKEELSVQITRGNASYYFVGIMDEKDFKQIVADMRFIE